MHTESYTSIFDAAFCGGVFVCDSKNYGKNLMSFNEKWPNRFKYIMIYIHQIHTALYAAVKKNNVIMY